MKKINDYLNYKESTRIKSHFLLPEDRKRPNCLLFDEKELCFENEESINIPYTHIDTIEISLCSRIYNPIIVAPRPTHYVALSYTGGATMTTRVTQVIYSVDMNIKAGNQEYLFESYSLKNIQEIVSLLKENNIPILDEIGMCSMLTKHTDNERLQCYLHMHYEEIAKQHCLDHPRGLVLIVE